MNRHERRVQARQFRHGMALPLAAPPPQRTIEQEIEWRRRATLFHALDHGMLMAPMEWKRALGRTKAYMLAVLVELCRDKRRPHWKEDGYRWTALSRVELQGFLICSRSTVTTTTAALAACGLIKKRHDGGRGQVNYYAIDEAVLRAFDATLEKIEVDDYAFRGGDEA